MAGADKATLLVGGRSIIDRQLTVLRALTPHLLIVGRNAETHCGLGVPITADRLEDAGPLGGLYTALVEAGTPRIVVVACDMPFLTPNLVRRLVEPDANVDAVVPRDRDGQHPLCACYHTGAAERLRRRLDSGLLSVRGAIADLIVHHINPDELASLDPDGRAMWNVNTPEDYARACAATGETPHSSPIEQRS